MTALEELISIIQGFTPEKLARFSKMVDLMREMSVEKFRRVIWEDCNDCF